MTNEEEHALIVEKYFVGESVEASDAERMKIMKMRVENLFRRMFAHRGPWHPAKCVVCRKHPRERDAYICIACMQSFVEATPPDYANTPQLTFSEAQKCGTCFETARHGYDQCNGCIVESVAR